MVSFTPASTYIHASIKHADWKGIKQKILAANPRSAKSLNVAEVSELLKRVLRDENMQEEKIGEVVTCFKERDINGVDFEELDRASFTDEEPAMQREILRIIKRTREYVQTLTKSSEFGAARKVRLHRPSQFT